jgi:hypothetical protein
MKKVERIPDDEYVLRRIYPQCHNDGVLDSTAFDDRYDRPSVHWEKHAKIDEIVRQFPGFDFFLRLRVGDIRREGHDVIHEPDKESDDYSHCVIIPADGKWTRSKKRGLAGHGIRPVLGVRIDLPPKKENEII